MESLPKLLEASAALHRHLCPRQVIGVRMGTLAGKALGLELPQADKRLLTIVETDGCFADGIAVATNCWVGRRTLRVEDYGKVAATFVDTRSGLAVRIVPRPEARVTSRDFAREAHNRWEAMLLGYQRMPDEMLLDSRPVRLTTAVEHLIGLPGRKAMCEACGEEVINGREVQHDGSTLCRSCVGQSYCAAMAPIQALVGFTLVESGVG